MVLGAYHRRLRRLSHIARGGGRIAELVLPVLVLDAYAEGVLGAAQGRAHVVHHLHVDIRFHRRVAPHFILAFRVDEVEETFEREQRRQGDGPGACQHGVRFVRVAARHLRNRREGTAGGVAFAQQQQAGVEEAGHVPHQRGAGHQHALARVVADVIFRVDVEAKGDADAAHGAELDVAAAHLADIDGVAVHQVGLLRAGRLAERAGILAVGDEEIEVDEVAAVFVAAGVRDGKDVFLDVVRVERLAVVIACAPAQRGIAPFGGLGSRAHAEGGSEAEQQTRYGFWHFRLLMAVLENGNGEWQGAEG